MSKNILIVGGSSGLGSSLLDYYVNNNSMVWSLSRTTPKVALSDKNHTWLKTDLANPKDISKAYDKLADVKIDLVIYSAAIWDDRNIINQDSSSIYNTFSINSAAFLLLVSLITKNQNNRCNFIAIGSTWGNNFVSKGLASYSSSKAALRSAVYSLRHEFKGTKAIFSVIMPGTLSTNDNLNSPNGIPHSDIIHTINYICSISQNAVVQEVFLPYINDNEC